MENQHKANSLIERGNELHNSGDKLSAAPYYREAAELFEPYASFMLVAADSYLEFGKYRDAAAAYQAVLDNHPDHDQARRGLKKARKLADKQAKKNSDLSGLQPVAPSDDGGRRRKKLFGRK
ncbi:MAG: tetratricopeptide repeat protein [Acidimicrobiia bacterium]|nr:tetratricopeptide repeat protein [Acidimicrobiia bacterium]